MEECEAEEKGKCHHNDDHDNDVTELPGELESSEIDTPSSSKMLKNDSHKDIAKVMRIVDADTIEVNVNEDMVDVRLLLVDCPETVHPKGLTEKFGVEASAFAKKILTGKQVQLEYDGPKWDHYGRILAYMWVDGKLFNQMLLEEGFAHIAYVYNPPYKYYDLLARAQDKAKIRKKGIWGIVGSEGGVDYQGQMDLFGIGRDGGLE